MSQNADATEAVETIETRLRLISRQQKTVQEKLKKIERKAEKCQQDAGLLQQLLQPQQQKQGT
jgi:prefoldin subunit 5